MICKVFALEAGLVLIVTTEAREILIVTYYIIRHIFRHKDTMDSDQCSKCVCVCVCVCERERERELDQKQYKCLGK